MTAGEAPAVPVALSHQSSPARRGFFENHPPSPSLPLKKGLHLSPKSSLLRREDLKPGRLGLYSQTSFNFVDFRLRSAEHSSELDALLSLARKFAPQGVAREYLTQQNCDCFTQQSCDCLTHDVRVFVRRGRGGASF